MGKEFKMEMIKKARMIRGLVNVLKYDAEYICADAKDFDLIGLGVSLEETKDTLQKMIDYVAELEYAVYLSKRDDA